MKTTSILVLVLAVVGVLAVIGLQRQGPRLDVAPPASTPLPAASQRLLPVGENPTSPGDTRGFLYGRVTTDEGVTYEGRLRWGGDEEAFWNDYFNGTKVDNRWAARVPPGELPTERSPLTLFGVELAVRERPLDLTRPFMARFGDVARIEADRQDLRVTLKSGTVVDLDRYGADDVGDGLRVWDREGGAVDLGEWQIRSVELLPTPGSVDAPARLHGTVRTVSGDRFTGTVQWNRADGLASDQLNGLSAGGKAVNLPFGSIRSIARHSIAHQPGVGGSSDGSRVTLTDGREMVLTGGPETGDGHRGVYVDDPRYGRVLVSWDAFRRVDLTAGGSGPGYADFPSGRPLAGRVITRAGRRLAGRLVFDLDESETTDTLDAPSRGVNHTIPFGLVASIRPAGEGGAEEVEVTLHNGEELRLEAGGDLGATNAGLLVFTDGGQDPTYVPWGQVERIVLARP